MGDRSSKLDVVGWVCDVRHVVRLAGLSREDLATLQRRAIGVSFAKPSMRADVLAEIDGWAVNA